MRQSSMTVPSEFFTRTPRQEWRIADYVAHEKYLGFNDYRGGGHFSGRITAAIVAVGAILKKALEDKNIYIGTHIKQVGKVKDADFNNHLQEIKGLQNKKFPVINDLAEAFGAVVEFDAATQAVVAELDGTKVVMTIGSEVYTVNGVAKTADVAPFISDSRTMVPVRFAAEAFGITVTPIYAEDGSVADVLFTK